MSYLKISSDAIALINQAQNHKFCRGEAFVPGFTYQSRIYLHECFALPPSSQGEAFGYKNLWTVAQLIARMLRPYIMLPTCNATYLLKKCQRSRQLPKSVYNLSLDDRYK
jgi:hypothetical protein